jgi:hypothetical protein
MKPASNSCVTNDLRNRWRPGDRLGKITTMNDGACRPSSCSSIRCAAGAASRDSRTRVDWAEEIRRLLEEDYPHARKVKLVCDNLNTHDKASLYEAFPAAEAHRLWQRLEIHHTPRSGSWLNVAEIELAILSRQCLDRRIGSAPELARELKAWQQQRNSEASVVQWRFTTADARIRLRHLYPQF